MIKSVKVTNYMGESLTIPLIWNDGPFEIEKIEGLGPPKANINTTEIATILQICGIYIATLRPIY